jgi:hypothetical protein
VQIAGLAAICWAIWKLIKSPSELISFAAVFMNYWAGLHTSPDAENIRAGAASLLQLVAGASAPPPPAEDQPRIKDSSPSRFYDGLSSYRSDGD